MKEYLQKALDSGDVLYDRMGRPIFIVAKIEHAEYGWLGQPQDNRQIVLQYNDRGQLGRNTDVSSRDLRKPEYKFEHWDMLHPRIASIERIAERVWSCYKVDSCPYRPVIHSAAFPAGTFPDCPIGTSIKNPNVCPF